MEALTIIILGVIMTIGVLIFLNVGRRKPADVIPLDIEKREAYNKARLDFERGVEEAKARYLAKRAEYIKIKEEQRTLIQVNPSSIYNNKSNLTLIKSEDNKKDGE